ncbi:MAG TPA: hypothetical protein VFB02_04035 [Bradyrhizobium sp.]|nr:hypothetical protein [Bradyrhizobium sp.]
MLEGARLQHPMKMGAWAREVVDADFRGPGRGFSSPLSCWQDYVIPEIRGSKYGAWEAASHDHGMARAPRFEEVLVTFNTNP